MITTWKQDKLIQKWENITKVPKPIIQVDEIYFNEYLYHAWHENHYVINLSYFYIRELISSEIVHFITECKFNYQFTYLSFEIKF